MFEEFKDKTLAIKLEKDQITFEAWDNPVASHIEYLPARYQVFELAFFGIPVYFVSSQNDNVILVNLGEVFEIVAMRAKKVK